MGIEDGQFEHGIFLDVNDPRTSVSYVRTRTASVYPGPESLIFGPPRLPPVYLALLEQHLGSPSLFPASILGPSTP